MALWAQSLLPRSSRCAARWPSCRWRPPCTLAAWVEGKLGPYPFSTAGVLVTDSQSGMETQTLITLGDNDYVLSKPVLVHELVHLSTQPGQMALTVMSRGASSRASARVSPMTPCLEAQ